MSVSRQLIGTSHPHGKEIHHVVDASWNHSESVANLQDHSLGKTVKIDLYPRDLPAGSVLQDIRFRYNLSNVDITNDISVSSFWRLVDHLKIVINRVEVFDLTSCDTLDTVYRIQQISQGLTLDEIYLKNQTNMHLSGGDGSLDEYYTIGQGESTPSLTASLNDVCNGFFLDIPINYIQSINIEIRFIPYGLGAALQSRYIVAETNADESPDLRINSLEGQMTYLTYAEAAIANSETLYIQSPMYDQVSYTSNHSSAGLSTNINLKNDFVNRSYLSRVYLFSQATPTQYDTTTNNQFIHSYLDDIEVRRLGREYFHLEGASEKARHMHDAQKRNGHCLTYGMYSPASLYLPFSFVDFTTKKIDPAAKSRFEVLQGVSNRKEFTLIAKNQTTTSAHTEFFVIAVFSRIVAIKPCGSISITE